MAWSWCYLTDLSNQIRWATRHVSAGLQKSISPSGTFGLMNESWDQFHHPSPAEGGSPRPLNAGHRLSPGMEAGGEGWLGSPHEGREGGKNLIIYELSNWKCLSGLREERSNPLSFVPTVQLWLPSRDSWHWSKRVHGNLSLFTYIAGR